MSQQRRCYHAWPVSLSSTRNPHTEQRQYCMKYFCCPFEGNGHYANKQTIKHKNVDIERSDSKGTQTIQTHKQCILSILTIARGNGKTPFDK